MAFDGLVTKAIVCELNSCIINGKINKVFEPNKNEILLGIYSGGKNYCLNISIDSAMSRINLTTYSKPNPQNVLNFCMVLRKHLVGGIIKRIYTNGLERIVFIDVECHNELNDLITKTLVIELMGKHSNIILLNSNSIVIDSLRHLNKFDKSTRDIFPGSKYDNVVSDKLDFLDVKTFDEFYKSLDVESIASFSISASLVQKYNGFGKNNILHLLDFLGITDNSSSTSDLKLVYNYLKNIVDMLNKNCLVYNDKCLFVKESSGKKKDYFVCISSVSDYSSLYINFFVDDFYYEKESIEKFKFYKDSILKMVLGQVNKIKDRISSIDAKIKECEKTDLYKLYGELITANLYRISDYPQDSVTVENYYDNNSSITIPLDSTISPSKNAKNYFKKYRKLQNTIAIVEKQKELAEAELKYLDSIVYEISVATTIDDVDNIYSEVCDNLIFKGKNVNTVNNHLHNFQNEASNSYKRQSQERNALLPAKYLIDGYTVLVGKNNKQNDYLTCKLAQNSDIWFHTKDIHGSHVVLKLDKTVDTLSSRLDISKSGVPDSLLYKCASIAAYFSKARMSQNVPVDYTFIKYVKKPNGAKPGMVIYTDNKTLYVNPDSYSRYLQ